MIYLTIASVLLAVAGWELAIRRGRAVRMMIAGTRSLRAKMIEREYEHQREVAIASALSAETVERANRAQAQGDKAS